MCEHCAYVASRLRILNGLNGIPAVRGLLEDHWSSDSSPKRGLDVRSGKLPRTLCLIFTSQIIKNRPVPRVLSQELETAYL
jgi:hypothetical protein